MTREALKIASAANYAKTMPDYVDGNYVRGLEEGYKKGWEDADAHPRSPWISVKERLPEKINKFMSEPVLCRYTRGNKEYYHVSQYDYEFDEWQISNVTHWMPIPELQTT